MTPRLAAALKALKDCKRVWAPRILDELLAAYEAEPEWQRLPEYNYTDDDATDYEVWARPIDRALERAEKAKP